jgi:SAM-dependent methyltransferase
MSNPAVAPASPWDVFQPWDVERWGEVILDEREQRRWSQAIFLGGLGYMWNQARVVKEAIYTRLDLRPGDRVLVIGEVLDACGFVSEIRERIGSDGELVTFEIVREAREAYTSGQRGRGGQLATWQWRYTERYPDERFDAVAVLQGVQHTDDWVETAAELHRVLVPGRHAVLGEISFGPRFDVRAQADLHISYLLEKIFQRMGWHYREMPYYSEAELHAAFDPLFRDTGYFEWRGVEMFWGQKPQR